MTTEEQIIGASGSVEIQIESENTGKIYNLPKNTINKFPITIPNLNEVNNLKETVDGYDGETDDELRERYYFKVRAPVTSGNIYHYKKWAMEVEGVGGVKVFPLWNGNGTVKVVVVNSDIGEADATLLKRVRDYLEEVRPIGATVTVNSAVGKAITLNANIKEYFKKVGFKQDYVSYAQIGNIILNVQGVVDYDNLLLNSKAINVQLTAEEIPKLSTVTLTKEVV